MPLCFCAIDGGMMSFLFEYFRNCFLLFIPVLVWNILLYKRLPEFYQAEKWDAIPGLLDKAENLFRFFAFALPLGLRLEISGTVELYGLVLYVIGVLVYFVSWFIQIRFPDSRLAGTGFSRMAPAWTTIVWLVGIGLIGRSNFFGIRNGTVLYLAVVVTFVSIHTYHAWYVWKANQ